MSIKIICYCTSLDVSFWGKSPFCEFVCESSSLSPLPFCLLPSIVASDVTTLARVLRPGNKELKINSLKIIAHKIYAIITEINLFVMEGQKPTDYSFWKLACISCGILLLFLLLLSLTQNQSALISLHQSLLHVGQKTFLRFGCHHFTL